MQLPLSLLLSASTLITATLAQQQTQQDISVKCQRFPPSLNGNLTYNPEAISALATALKDNSFNPALPTDGIKLSPGFSSRVGWEGNGGYQVCVQNWWFFKTLTVPLDTISEAVTAIQNTCCDDEGNRGTSRVPGMGGRQGKCQDAKAVVKATDGSEVKVVAQDYGDLCCGMWGC